MVRRFEGTLPAFPKYSMSATGLDVRSYFAIHILSGMMADPGVVFGQEAVQAAVSIADMLVAELAKSEDKTTKAGRSSWHWDAQKREWIELRPNEEA